MSGRGGKLVAGFVALHVLCCAVPLLITAGAFTGAGAMLGNGAIVAAGLLAVLAVAAVAAVVTSGGRPRVVDRRRCGCSGRLHRVRPPGRRVHSGAPPGRLPG